MSTVIRKKNGTATSGTTLTIDYSVDSGTASPLNSAHALILEVRSQAGSAVTPQPSTPSGWTLVGSAVSQSGNFTVRVDQFTRRCDSSVNSVTVAGATNVVRHGQLSAIDGILSNDYFRSSAVSSANATNVLTRSVTIPGSFVDAVNFISCATSGTAGGSGFTWNRGTAGFAGGSSSSSFSTRHETLTAVENLTYTATWTTTGLAAMVGTSYGGGLPLPAGSRTSSVTRTIHFGAYSNLTSLANLSVLEPVGWEGGAAISGTDIVVTDIPGRTYPVILSVDLVGPGGTKTEQVTLEAGGSAKTGFVIEMFDGTTWRG